MTKQPPKPTRRTVCHLGMATLLACSIAVADNGGNWEDDDYSYDKARRAVAEGNALPIAQVMQHLRSHTSSDIVALEYEFEFGRWVYEFKVVDRLGQLRRVHIDAATGELVNEQD